MKKIGLGVTFFLLVFVLTSAALVISIMFGMGFANFPRHLNHILLFFLLAGIAITSLNYFKEKIGTSAVLLAMGLSYVLIFVPKILNSELSFALYSSAYTITTIASVTAAYFYHKKRSLIIPLVLFALPLGLYFGGEARWQSFVTSLEEVETAVYDVPSYTFKSKDGSEVNKESQMGRITVLDFWFIGCPPCWSKFPEYQTLYDRYKTNGKIDFYAVNRPMRQDGEGELYTSIEREKYTFPVAMGDQAMMDDLGIKTYPTVMIIDQEGQVVHKGNLKGVEELIDKLLAD